MQRLVQGQITISRDMRERNLVGARHHRAVGRRATHGYVVTLDDITDLVTAQRTSAWADVARRIAHEIKNPLTPIQLSAERLKRKYGKVITEDQEVFDQCTDTIVRQVDDIKRMVDEFSSLRAHAEAGDRPPRTSPTPSRQVVFLQRVGNPDIDIRDRAAEPSRMPAQFDRRLISQALTNIVKNATEAIAAVPPEERGKRPHRVSRRQREGRDVVDRRDRQRHRPADREPRPAARALCDDAREGHRPRPRHRRRILEEHGGGMELSDAPDVAAGGRGAWVRLRFAAESVDSSVEQPKSQVLEAASES